MLLLLLYNRKCDITKLNLRLRIIFEHIGNEHSPKGSDTFVNLVHPVDVNHKSQSCRTQQKLA